MSLAETKEIMLTLQQIIAVLNNVETKTAQIQSDMPKTSKALSLFRQVERVALRFLVVVRDMGLPKEWTNMLESLSKILIMLNMINMSFNMIQRGPLGAFMSIFSLTGVSMAMPSMLEGYY